MSEEAFDYVVVGSGAAGSAVAGRLAAAGKGSVVLLEAGGDDRHLSLHIPGLGFHAVSKRHWNWDFQTEPEPGLNGRRQVFLAGKLLGGSSAINGMIYSRGHSQEYDEWARLGCTGWSAQDVLPFFRRSEDNARGSDHWHGSGGPMGVRQSRPVVPLYERFLEAAAASGIDRVDDPCADVVEGFGYYDVNVKNGRRISAATAFAKPAARSGRLTLITGAFVQRVLFDGRRAIGVEARIGDAIRAIHARREVIVCAGGIKSPHLLMLSGIGPAGHLADNGIDLLVDSPKVGTNLQNHPSLMMSYAVSQPVTSFSYLSPLGALVAGAQYLFGRRGVLAESGFGVGGFFRSDPSLNLSDVQVIISHGLMVRSMKPKPGIRDLLPKRHGFTVVVYQGTPYSRGSVRLRSGNPGDAPRVQSGYFSDPRDMPILVRGVRRMRELCARPEIAPYIESEMTPGPNIRTDAELEAFIRDNIGTSHHQCGTCAMGGDEDSVLDPRLRVRGVTGLRVADASAMPIMPNASLHAPTIMIGERAAEFVLADAA